MPLQLILKVNLATWRRRDPWRRPGVSNGMSDSPEQDPPNRPTMGRRMAWFFAIAVIIGVAFAAAAGLLSRLLLH